MMHIAIISTCDLNLYPAQYYLAETLAQRGARVTILSKSQPRFLTQSGAFSSNIDWFPIERQSGWISRLPIVRADYHGVILQLMKLRPTWIVAQHGQALAALLYKAFTSDRHPVKVAGYFADYVERAWWLSLLKRNAGRLDAYVDVCDLRLAWREAEWSRLCRPRFVVRNAPPLRNDLKFESHSKNPRLIFTGRDYGDAMRSDLLLRFIKRMCQSGFQVTWLMPGESHERSAAIEAVNHENFSVLEAVDKGTMNKLLASYDVGLLWTPTTRRQNETERTNYVSAASNKLGEYLASGLLIAHTGNPGLRFLPNDVGIELNPWHPEESAETLALLLTNRNRIKLARAAALRFHRDVLNASVQSDFFVSFLFDGKSQASTSDSGR